jgi:NAD(P)-dependent dehydrogenase (short-subunit alcohol dehydrogenase family)
MGNRLFGKVAFITGGGSGIGRSTAIRFAQEGAQVIICGRKLDPLNEVVSAVEKLSGKIEAIQADVSNEAEITQAIEVTAKKYGRLDILVNNAMAYSWGAIETTSTEDWKSNFSTTVDGTFWATRAALKIMKPQGSGSIINMSSIFSHA